MAKAFLKSKFQLLDPGSVAFSPLTDFQPQFPTQFDTHQFPLQSSVFA
jgi:hypothetical protein